jgi:hypothetical protein
MKTDLPERLRMLAESVTEWDNPITAKDDCLQAANEVEKNRNEIARLNGQTKWECQCCGGVDVKGIKENEKLRAENEELKNQVSALNEKITSLGKCGLNGTCACSYEHPGDVCDFHSPTVTRYRLALESIIKHQSIVAGAMGDVSGITKIAKTALAGGKGNNHGCKL